MNPNMPLIALALSCVNRVCSETFTLALIGDGAIFLGQTSCDNGAETTLIHRTPADTPTLVARLSRGVWKPEKEYLDRIVPNSSVVFNRTTFNDKGAYEMTCGADNVVSIHELMVVVPADASVSAGGRVKLPCHLVTAGRAAGFVRWERNGELVFELDLNSGESRDGVGFEGRVSVSGYRQGDTSLEVLRAKPGDQGAFLCYRVEGEQRDWGTPAAVRLTVNTNTDPTDRTTPVPGVGSTEQLPTWIIILIIITVLSLVANFAILVAYFLYRWLKSKNPSGTDEGGSPPTVCLKLLERGSSGAPTRCSNDYV